MYYIYIYIYIYIYYVLEVCFIYLFFFVNNSVFVCVEVLHPSQPSGVMLSAVSLPNHRFTGQV